MRLIPFIIISFLAHFAFADEVLKIVSGGPGSLKAFERIKAEMEKVAGTKIDLSIYKQTVAIQAMLKDQVDGVLMTSPDALLAENAEEFKGVQKTDLIWHPFYEGAILFILNKGNTIQQISKEHFRDMAQGKIKNWKEIGGPDAPVKLYVAESLIGATKSVAKTYLGETKIPNAEKVLDQAGVSRAVMKDVGAIGIGSGRMDDPSIDVRYFNSEAKIILNLVAKKGAKKGIVAILDELKKRPILKSE